MTPRGRNYPDLESRTVGAWTWKPRLLWSKIQQAQEEECWRWLGATSQHANLFGAKKNNRPQMTQAARIIWMDITGQDAAMLEIKHNCGNRYCCNPRHFFTKPNHMRLAEPNNPKPRASLPKITISGTKTPHQWWQI